MDASSGAEAPASTGAQSALADVSIGVGIASSDDVAVLAAAPLARGGAAAVASNQAEKKYCDEVNAFLLKQPGGACPLLTLGEAVKNPYGKAGQAKKTARAILDSDAQKRFLTTQVSVSLKAAKHADVPGVEVATNENGRAARDAEAADAQAGGGPAKPSEGPGKGKVGCC